MDTRLDSAAPIIEPILAIDFDFGSFLKSFDIPTTELWSGAFSAKMTARNRMRGKE